MSVYVWGSNNNQQLIGQNGLHCYAPAIVNDQFDGQIPIQVATGDGHTLILCESGDIYSFGKGKEGQLGREYVEHKRNKNDAHHVEPKTRVVTGLEHESIVGIAAGALTSYAITAAGEVYHWGLIHQSVNDHYDPNNTSSGMVQAGQLTGLAQDQNVTVAVDKEARSTMQKHKKKSGREAAMESRALRDIVRDSTERWMMPTDDNEREYYEELRAMGYQNEEVEERMQSRGREYHGMLAMGCRRHVQTVPLLVPNLGGIRIVSISSGYAHVMLLSDKGQLYGAGYNDRGQLGLGHRINTSEFKHVDFLATKFVLQVVCGQQHTLCRAVDSAGADSSLVFVGSGTGADVFVWGNGMLGQLGIGLRGTSKGRLLPTLNTTLHSLYPLGVIDVAAGHNFSAVVTSDGSVFSFGHAEYNQHGTGNQANRDYNDPYYYFEPRVVSYFDNREKRTSGASESAMTPAQRVLAAAASHHKKDKVRMKSLTCGANFTVGIDENGNLYSWGWNESGVLGHGFNHFSSSPSQITAIGRGFDGCKVMSLVAGSKHVVALSQAQGNPWALTFRSILESAPYADCAIHIQSGATSTVFACHKAVLSCRSKYFAGFIRAADREEQEEQLYNRLSALEMNSGSDSDKELNHKSAAAAPLRLTLTSSYANASTVRSLLEYLYLDRVHLPHHKRRELLHLATDLNIPRLMSALETDSFVEVTSASGPENVLVAATGEYSSSYFVQDMSFLVGSRAFCDIVFVEPLMEVPTPSCEREEDGQEDNSTAAGGESAGTLPVFDPSQYSFVLYAHRAIVSRIAYFEAIIAGHFSESANYMLLSSEDGSADKAVLIVDISGLQTVDGIDLDTFRSVVSYAYTGRLSAIDPLTISASDLEEEEAVDMSLVMGALIAANRLGFGTLTQHCERILSLHIGEYFPHNAENCLSFAASYNIPRLERQCLKVLKRSLPQQTSSSCAVGAGETGEAVTFGPHDKA